MKKVIVIVGGSAGIAPRYKQIIEKAGYKMLHAEYKVPSSASKTTGVVLVIVMSNLCGHSLQSEAMKFFKGAPIAIINSSGTSMLKATLEQHLMVAA